MGKEVKERSRQEETMILYPGLNLLFESLTGLYEHHLACESDVCISLVQL